MSSIYQRNGIWQVQFVQNGRTCQKSLRTRNQKTALRLQAEIDAALPAVGPLHREGPRTVTDLSAAYSDWAEEYYREGAGASAVRGATGYLKPWADVRIDEFGPRLLREYREVLIAADLARSTINAYTATVQRMFKWAVSYEFARAETYTALATVGSLGANRSRARETEAVRPVPDNDVEAVLHSGAAQWVKDLIQLQLLTAARPGELLGLTPEDIDRTGEVWTAVLSDHKEAHRGKTRTLYFGPRAQAILVRYLLGRKRDYPLFSRSDRAYRAAIATACRRLGVPHWHPHQLRHNAATRLRAEHGLDVAQLMLGHAQADVTQIYAEADQEKARQVALDVG